MSAIKFHKASEYKKVFNENGLARQSVLTGEYKDVAIYKCTLAAGAKWEPELYPQQEKVQILLFTEGTGYVATPHKAFQIEEVSVFVPRFDQESFFIQADSELSFLQIVANLSDYDRENMADSHIALPRFRPVSQGWQYQGYTSDLSRTVCVGTPDEKTVRLYDAIRAGTEAAIAAARPGVRACELFQIAVETTRSNGIPHYRRHHVGHCLGLEVYDDPSITPDNQTVLQADMALNIETPYYELGWGGVQVEDTVAITENGAVRLDVSDNHLIVLDI